MGHNARWGPVRLRPEHRGEVLRCELRLAGSDGEKGPNRETLKRILDSQPLNQAGLLLRWLGFSDPRKAATSVGGVVPEVRYPEGTSEVPFSSETRIELL